MTIKRVLRDLLIRLSRPPTHSNNLEEVLPSLDTLIDLARMDGLTWTDEQTKLLNKAVSHFKRYQAIRRWFHLLSNSYFRNSSADLIARANTLYRELGQERRNRPIIMRTLDSSKKLLFISGKFPSIFHGGGLRLFDLITELSEDYQIDLFSSFTPNEDSSSLDLIRPHLNLVALNVNKSDFSPNNLVAWMKKQKISISDYTAIHLEYPQSEVFVDWLSSCNRPIFYTMMENLHRARFRTLLNALTEGDDIIIAQTWLDLAEVFHTEERLWKNADFRIAVTDADCRAAEFFFSESGIVIPTALSNFSILKPLEKIPTPTIEPNTFGFLGYFGHQPNLDGLAWYLEKVHPIVCAHQPDFKFKIFGQGPLKDLQKKFRQDNRLEFVGSIQNIPKALSSLSFCISPLVSGSGVRGKLNQYSICKKTTVTTSIGAEGLKYRHNQEILIADSPIDFANSMIQLIRSPELSLKLGESAQSMARELYTWGPQISKIKNLY